MKKIFIKISVITLAIISQTSAALGPVNVARPPQSILPMGASLSSVPSNQSRSAFSSYVPENFEDQSVKTGRPVSTITPRQRRDALVVNVS